MEGGQFSFLVDPVVHTVCASLFSRAAFHENARSRETGARAAARVVALTVLDIGTTRDVRSLIVA